MKVYLNFDDYIEYGTVDTVKSSLWDIEIELTKAELSWIQKVEEEVGKVQELLIQKWKEGTSEM